MGIAVIYITFIGLICVLFVISTYLVASLIMRRLQEREVENKARLIEQVFTKHMALSSAEDAPEQELAKIKKQVLSSTGLEAFNLCYTRYVEKHGESEQLTAYVARIIDYQILMKSRIIRDQYRITYILHLLAQYHIDTPDVEAFALEALDSKSQYNRNNALRVICNFKDVDLIINSLMKISESKHYFNDKILIDFFDSYSGDETELTEALIENIENLSNRVQQLIPGHLMNKRIDTPDARELMFEFLESDDKELVIAATKYFGWVTDERAGPYVLKNLDNPEWEVRAISARTAQRGYESPEMVDALEKTLRDPDWYVRLNSAYSFIAMVKDDDRIDRVIHGGDRYATDVTLYVMFVKGMIDYDKYTELTKPSGGGKSGNDGKDGNDEGIDEGIDLQLEAMKAIEANAAAAN